MNLPFRIHSILKKGCYTGHPHLTDCSLFINFFKGQESILLNLCGKLRIKISVLIILCSAEAPLLSAGELTAACLNAMKKSCVFIALDLFTCKSVWHYWAREENRSWSRPFYIRLLISQQCQEKYTCSILSFFLWPFYYLPDYLLSFSSSKKMHLFNRRSRLLV